ncbi:MAG: FAD binding domain-containing protein [Pseudomonadota bacterium]
MYYRRLPKFEYLAPKSVEEVCSLLQERKGGARVSAGGTIVVHRMKERVGVRKFLIGLKAVADLDFIDFDPSSGLKIGTMASLQSVADSPVVKKRFAILARACAELGTPQIRAMGTIGGNLCAKFPTAETVPVLIALGAKARIWNAEGDRMVPIDALNKDLKQADLLTEIHVPTPDLQSGWGYEKYALRERLDYATVAAAVVMTSKGGVCADVVIALGGVPSKRAAQAEKAVKGQKKTARVIEKAAQAASKNAKPISDIHCSAEYKKELLKVMVQRALEQAWGD